MMQWLCFLCLHFILGAEKWAEWKGKPGEMPLQSMLLHFVAKLLIPQDKFGQMYWSCIIWSMASMMPVSDQLTAGFVNSDKFAGDAWQPSQGPPEDSIRQLAARPQKQAVQRCNEDLFVHRDALLQQFADVELTAGTVVEFDVERDHHKKSVIAAVWPELLESDASCVWELHILSLLLLFLTSVLREDRQNFVLPRSSKLSFVTWCHSLDIGTLRCLFCICAMSVTFVPKFKI